MEHLGKSKIEDLNEEVRTFLASVVNPRQPYAVVDFPNYSNVGDSAIWLGLTKALREHTGRRPSYVAHQYVDTDELGKALPEGPILICGGGNFGDLWERHQNLRYLLMEKFPGRPIVQAPQSIKFRDKANVDICRRAISKHGNFRLAVRDHASYDFAIENLDCQVSMVPDSAFCLGPLDRTKYGRSQHDTVYMLRKDVETTGVDLATAFDAVDGPIWDWLDEPNSTTRKSPFTAAASLMSGNFSRHSLRERHFEAVADRRVERGLAMLAAGNRIVTDRLHVHILAVLLNIPHVALDNSYGKIHGFIDAWTGNCRLVKKASNSQEVLEGLANGVFQSQGVWKVANGTHGYEPLH